ncbi:MAG: DNA gyrase inhibitor YacG [Planctomycetota bacterium]
MPKIDCPHCGKPLEYQSIKDHPHFPFCSKRCRLVDLGMWIEGEHKITEDLSERHGCKEADREGKSKA